MQTEAARPDDRISSPYSDAPRNSRIDESFRMRDAAKLSVRGVDRAHLGATELRYDGMNFGMTDPIVHEDAFLIGLQFIEQPFHELWYEGRALPVRDCRSGDALFYDLNSVDGAKMSTPFHSLHFYLSRAFLTELTADLEVPRIEHFRPGRDEVVRDVFICRMGRSLRPAVAAPFEANQLYASHVMLSIGIYACATYGGMRTPRTGPSGLSTWQERVAKELIEAHIDGTLALRHIAESCGLSSSHFAHAFKASVGMAPHQWLLHRRVERAKHLLNAARQSLTDIALECGFADQSHFTRVFRRATGCPPGRWVQQAQ
jgi:AraC-like DNA-binding protein